MLRNKHISLIREMYDNNILLHAPLEGEKLELSIELLEILKICDGIEEIVNVKGKKESIGWILYSYEMIKNNTEFYSNEYGIQGYVFSDDGAGNVFVLNYSYFVTL